MHHDEHNSMHTHIAWRIAAKNTHMDNCNQHSTATAFAQWKNSSKELYESEKQKNVLHYSNIKELINLKKMFQ